MLEKISFTIKSKSYESLPLITGRLIDYYKRRTFFTGGQYNAMYGDLTIPEKVMDMVDCKAFMYTFCPQFIEDIKPNDLDELGVEDYLEVVKVYRKDIKPSLEELTAFLSKKDDGK